MAQFVNIYPCDLRKGPVETSLKHMYLGDVEANRVGVNVTDGGEAVALSGTCSGTAILCNGGTVALTGVISGNQAYIDMPAAVYTVEGPVDIYLAVTTSGVTTTLLHGYGNAVRTDSGVVIDPGTIIPSVAALISDIDEAVASIPADYSDLLGTIAPDFSSSTAYTAGQYVWYSGTLYRFTSDHAAGSWTGTDAIAAEIGEDVADLRGAFHDILVEVEPDEPSIGQVTLTNAENAQSFYNELASSTGLTKTSYSNGVATFTGGNGSEVSPYVAHNGAWGTKKWIVGFKYKITKLDQSIGNPEYTKVHLGATSYNNTSYTWGDWIDFAQVFDGDLTRIRIALALFASAPASNTFTLEVKNMYVYDATDVDADMCTYIMTQQSSNYQDGTVIYGEAPVVSEYAPDTTLAISGKAADSKAVGDAISAKISSPTVTGTVGQVLALDENNTPIWQTLENSEIDDEAGEGDTDKTWSANKLSNEFGKIKDNLDDILVYEQSGATATLTNLENATSFYTGVASGSTSGIKKVSNTDGIATFSAYGGSQLSPYIRHTGSWGEKKWICGFKYKLNKLDQSLVNPEKIRIYLGASQYYDSAVVWDQWVDFSEVITTDLTRISIIMANFAVAPSADSFKVEVKDVYLYDATDVSSELCALVMSQQSENYQDGTVTYGDIEINYIPDTTLSFAGKAADAKAVGDAIGVPTYNVKKYGVKGDGIADDTNAIQALFTSKHGIFYFPSGTYKISGTLSIPESSEMCGDGDTTVISVYDYTNLDYRIFRNNTRVYPYILVENPYTYLHDFKIVGSTPEYRTHYGIGVIDTHHCDIKNITAYNINYDPTRQDSDTEYASAYGITSLRSDYVTIENCNVSLCGYECIGVSDNCDHSVVRDCYTQDGWRTCIQVHRGAVNTLIDNCYMKQTHEKYHASFTVHGTDGHEVENLSVTNCTMECVVNGAQPNTENAPAQMMSYIINLVFMANRIFGGKRAFYITSDSTNAKIIGNDFHCNDQSDYGVYIKSLLSIVIGNCLANEANDPVNVITNNPILLGNIGIS